MKKLLFLLFLLLNFSSIFAQKNHYGIGMSYGIAGELFDESDKITSLSLAYERKFAKKWAFSIAILGQKSKAIENTVTTFFTSTGIPDQFVIKTTHRFLGIEHIYTYHPNGFGDGVFYGVGFNLKLYNSINREVTPNTPDYILYGTINNERNVVFSCGYNESFENGARFNVFGNFAFSPTGNNIFPAELRLGCHFMFSDLFFQNLKKAKQ